MEEALLKKMTLNFVARINCCPVFIFCISLCGHLSLLFQLTHFAKCTFGCFKSYNSFLWEYSHTKKSKFPFGSAEEAVCMPGVNFRSSNMLEYINANTTSEQSQINDHCQVMQTKLFIMGSTEDFCALCLLSHFPDY